VTYPSQQDQYPQPQVEQAAASGAAPMPAAQPPLRQVAGVAMLVSAGLAVGGSLVPNVYTAYSVVGGNLGYTSVTNLWHTTYAGINVVLDGQPGHNYVPGIPLMVGAALAVLVGVALLRTARYRGQGPRLWAVAAGSLVAGLTATDCLVAEATHSRQGIYARAALLSAHYGAGMWLLMAAGLIAVGGVAAAALADRSWGPRLVGPTEPAGPIVYAIEADESPTPPHGFPAQPEPEP
jgi:hypothetical protein